MNRKVFCKQIGYEFSDERLLDRALTHSSYAKDNGLPQEECNERQEYLGDAVLDMVTAKMLYDRLPEAGEGALTKFRAMVVKKQSLASKAGELGIGEQLALGRGEDLSGGRTRESNLANAMEALIAAVFLDGGYEAVAAFIEKHFSDMIDDVISGRPPEDHKSALQEKLQKKGPCDIRYETVREEGPEHDKTFYVDVIVSGKVCGKGEGKSKKEAEQNAARAALEEGEKDVF